jgi:predicted glycosyltransferase involved in capsule biosynthesis
MLSVVLPVRITAETAYLLERLQGNLALLGGHPEVECVVVDSASAPPYAAAIRRACDRPGCLRVADPEPQHPFAPGLARNAGARAASGDTVLFYDVDLVCQADFLARVQAWASTERDAHAFLMIPCLYLTRSATEAVAFGGQPVDLSPYLASVLAGDADRVNHVALSTSTVAVSRTYFLELGGNRAAYRGHGCEDFDLLHRMAARAPIGPRPADYYDDVKARFPGDYRGFRAYLARYALPNLFEGLYTAHLWHPRSRTRYYFRRRRTNEALLQTLMRRDDVEPGRWQATAGPLAPLGEHIAELQRRAGFDPDDYPGLFRWRPGVTGPGRTPGSRLRKLLFRPRAFFSDSRVPGLRALRHLFSR